MYKYLKITCFFCFAFSLIAFQPMSGQSLTDKVSLNWSTRQIWDDQGKKAISILFFDDALIGEKFLPVFQNRIPVPMDAEHIKVTIVQSLYETVPDSGLTKVSGISDIRDTIILRNTIATERKQNYLIYSLVPLRKNKQNGKLERLKYFVANISWQTGATNSRNSTKLSSISRNSVLNSGDWYKFQVDKSGVYQIFYNDLTDLGLKNPENVRIYGHGGNNLPELNNGGNPDDPIEIPIMFFNGTDNVFNSGDYFIFYAQGPGTISYDTNNNKFVHNLNAFNDNVTYFITSNPGGKKIQSDTPPQVPENSIVNSYDFVDFHEKNLYNLIGSGSQYYGESFDLQTSYNFVFDLSNLVPSEKVLINAEFAARSASTTYFRIYSNNQLVTTATVNPSNVQDLLGKFAQESSISALFNTSAGENTIKLVYDKGSNDATGWLNYMVIHARQYLKMNDSQLEFRDTRSVGDDNIARFDIQVSGNQFQVLDITDIFDVKQLSTTFQNNTVSFKDETNILKNYIAFNTKTGLLRPNILKDNGKVANQNLHGLQNIDYLIVTHPDFLKQAQELAQLHVEKDNITTAVVTTEEVYNEFSSGNYDPAAIRNFAKYMYDNATSEAEYPKYLLLFGDGSYDNKSTNSSNSNFIPTYQSKNSLIIVSSYVTDDYFGILENNEGVESGLMDIGVGRLPVRTVEKAQAVVNKIRKYLNNSIGSWRNQICFIGDDEDSNIHMQQADELSKYVTTNYPAFNIDKIYLDAYNQVSTSSGQRYPDANTAIYNRLNQGALIVNYTGHGNERGLTHEQVIRQIEDIQKWKNKFHPLFITATCEFSRFDDYHRQTAGEDVLLNEEGGGIALCSTTRVVYSGPNYSLNYQFYKNAFLKDKNEVQIALGEIMRRTKNNLGYDPNKLNFTLLGDPALKLAIPEYFVATDSINGNPVSATDTISAYQTVSIAGRVTDIKGNTITDFDGKVLPIVFDKPKKVTTLSNDGLAPFHFSLQNDILYKGQASVNNGKFKFSFILPRDIDYNYGTGKLSYYAYNDSSDASGNYSKVYVGGISELDITDNNGPLIKLFLNDTLFRNGGVSGNFPVLFSKVKDENGINIGGNGIGHDIEAYIDNDKSLQFNLNSYFESDLDDYKSGSIEFNLPEMTPGKHSLTLKVWDIFNNSSTATINFNVLDLPVITNIYLYPNPMSDNLNIRFEHNNSGTEMDVTVAIFNSMGGKVNELNTKIFPSGFASGNIPWDGFTSAGNRIKKGVYFLQVKYTSKNGTAIGKSQKLIVIE